MLRIYPVELMTTELETGSPSPTDTHRPTHYNSTRLNMFSFQFFNQICRQSSWASCEFSSLYIRATLTRFNWIVQSRRRRRCVVGFTFAFTTWEFET